MALQPHPASPLPPLLRGAGPGAPLRPSPSLLGVALIFQTSSSAFSSLWAPPVHPFSPPSMALSGDWIRFGPAHSPTSLSLFTSLPFPPSLPLLSLLSPFLSILANFPFFFYISLIALGSLFLFHFSPLLVASIHLVHNSHSINIGECLCFCFCFFFGSVYLSSTSVSHCADLFSYACSHPAFIFGSRPCFLDESQGCHVNPLHLGWTVSSDKWSW